MRKLLTTISVASMLAVAPALAQQIGPGSQPSSPPSSMPDKSSPPSSMDKSAPDKTAPKTPGAAAEAPDAKASMGDYRASNLLNASLKNASGESVGDINDLLLDSDGKITHVIVGVGGFLGIGERDVALRFDQVQLSRDSNNRLSATASVTKESLKTAPEWKDPNANTSQTSSPSSTPSKPSK
ncbi:MAG TPA: PRC-barrel domain-containing protein [Hyphomicrobiaceae bacterium]|nr:PRC-barrel domain-containing protein [Hyphomicrobiaceae bacterium]